MSFSLKKRWLRSRFNLKERSQFYDILRSYLDSGFSFVEALSKIEARARKDKNFKADIYRDILDSLAAGKSITDSLEPWVSENELMLIEGGEKNANLSDSFEEAVYLSESIGKIKMMISSRSFGPIIMILLGFAYLYVYVNKLTPTILDLLPLQEWEGWAQNLYVSSHFIYENIWIFLLLFFLFVVISLWSLNKWTGRLRSKVFDKIIPWSSYKIFVEASFLISMAALIRGNYTILSALLTIRDTAPRYLAWFLDKMIDNIRESKDNEGAALNVGLLNKEVAGILEDSADLANFKDVIYNLGRRNIESALVRIHKQTATASLVTSMVVLGYIGATFFSIYIVSSTIQM